MHVLRPALRAVANEPAVFLAELAWNWVWTATALAMSAAVFCFWLDSIPVGNGDLIAILSGFPPAILAAMSHIIKGHIERLASAGVVAGIFLTALWAVLAALSRHAQIVALTSQDGTASARGKHTLRSILALYLLRALLTLTCLLALVGAGVVAYWVGSGGPSEWYARGAAFGAMVWIVMSCWWLLSGLLWAASAPAVAGKNIQHAVGEAYDLLAAHPLESLRIALVLSSTRMVLTVAAVFFAASAIRAGFDEPPIFAVILLSLIAFGYSLLANFVRATRTAAGVVLWNDDHKQLTTD